MIQYYRIGQSLTFRAGGDFHNAMPPPMSAALPPPEDHPPTWHVTPRVTNAHNMLTVRESLDVNSNAAVPIDEKIMMDQRDYANLEAALDRSDKPSIEQKGFVV